MKSLLSIGVKQSTPPLEKFGKLFFNLDCIIAILSSALCFTIYQFLPLPPIYSIITATIFFVFIFSLWLHKNNKYKQAIHTALFFTFGVLTTTSILLNSFYLPLYLIPLGISFFIYLAHKERESILYFSFFVLSSIVVFAITYFNSSPEKHDVLKTVDCVVQAFLTGLFFYKTIALIYIYRKTIYINTKNEEALKISEHQYRTQFEKTQLGMVVFDNKMSIQDVNTSFCKMIGYSKEELLTQNILENCLKTTPEILQKMQQMIKGDLKQFRAKKTFQRKDGTPLITSAFITGIYDQHKNFVSTNCSFLDDTDKILTQEALHNNETVYRDVFENMSDCLIRLDDKGNIIEFNPAANKVFNFENLHTLNVADLIHPEDREKSAKYFHKLKTEGSYSGYEGRLILPGQKIKYIEVDSIAVKDKSGKLIGSRDIVKDMTERKLAEIALKESESRYRTLFENAFDGICFFDLETQKNISCNSKFAELFGVDQNEVQKINFFDFVPEIQENGESSKDFFKQRYQEIMTNDKIQYQCVHKNKDGSFHNIEITSIRLPAPNRNLVVSILKDISDKKKQDKIIQQTVEELNQKNDSLQKYIESNLQLENFAYMASHDLKAPLRTVISYAQLISKRSSHKLDQSELEFLDFIIGATKNMSSLIEALLTYSKVDAQEKSFKAFSPEVLIYSIVQELKSDIEEHNVEVIIKNMPAQIVADTTRLRQLFQNLISNSIKFKSIEQQATIEIHGFESDNYFQFSVQDNGIGIKPEFHDKIFNLFTKLHNSQQYEGTGIGLALCKKIIDQHEGKIWIESEFGKGTTFFFTIPKSLEFEQKEIKNSQNNVSLMIH